MSETDFLGDFAEEKEAVLHREAAPAQMDGAPVHVYKGLCSFMRNYASGELPQASRVLAMRKIPEWLDLIQLTEPLKWSTRGLHAVTVLFTQKSTARKMQVFCSEVLLNYLYNLFDTDERIKSTVIDTIAFASRQPQPFVSGFLLPLCSEKVYCKREAEVLSNVLGSVRLPADHANAFMIKISESDSCVLLLTLSIMVRKGYPLAVATIDALVAYFLRSSLDEHQARAWSQCLLDFVARYGKDVTAEQREALEEAAKRHRRENVTDKIVEKLRTAPQRDDEGL